MLLATVVIDPPSVVALGAIFVLFMSRSIAAGSPLRRSVLVGGFVGGWMALCFSFMGFKYPGWMLVYLIDPKSLPAALWVPLFVLVMTGCGALGGFLAHRFLAAGRRAAAFAVVGISGAIWIALFAVTMQRYVRFGSYEEWNAGTARLLSEQPAVMHDMNLVTIATAVPLVSLLALIVWRNRRAAQPTTA